MNEKEDAKAPDESTASKFQRRCQRFRQGSILIRPSLAATREAASGSAKQPQRKVQQRQRAHQLDSTEEESSDENSRLL